MTNLLDVFKKKAGGAIVFPVAIPVVTIHQTINPKIAWIIKMLTEKWILSKVKLA